MSRRTVKTHRTTRHNSVNPSRSGSSGCRGHSTHRATTLTPRPRQGSVSPVAVAPGLHRGGCCETTWSSSVTSTSGAAAVSMPGLGGRPVPGRLLEPGCDCRDDLVGERVAVPGRVVVPGALAEGDRVDLGIRGGPGQV